MSDLTKDELQQRVRELEGQVNAYELTVERKNQLLAEAEERRHNIAENLADEERDHKATRDTFKREV